MSVSLLVLFGLSACVVTPPFLAREAKYHQRDHATAYAAAVEASDDTRIPYVDYDPVTLKVGEKRLMTTSAGGMGGWFLSVETGDYAIAKPVSGKKGKTYVKAVSPGQTMGYYGNGATLHQSPELHAIGAFQITVVEAD